MSTLMSETQISYLPSKMFISESVSPNSERILLVAHNDESAHIGILFYEFDISVLLDPSTATLCPTCEKCFKTDATKCYSCPATEYLNRYACAPSADPTGEFFKSDTPTTIVGKEFKQLAYIRCHLSCSECTNEGRICTSCIDNASATGMDFRGGGAGPDTCTCKTGSMVYSNGACKSKCIYGEMGLRDGRCAKMCPQYTHKYLEFKDGGHFFSEGYSIDRPSIQFLYFKDDGVSRPLELPAPSNITGFPGEVTISFWIKKKGAWTGTVQLVQVLGAVHITALDAGTGTGDVTAKIIDDQGTSVTVPLTLTPFIAQDVWVHVAFAMRPLEAALYVCVPPSLTCTSHTQVLTAFDAVYQNKIIVGGPELGTTHGDEYIAEIKVLERYSGAETIEIDYFREYLPFSRDAPSLIAYWKLDAPQTSGSKQYLQDYSKYYIKGIFQPTGTYPKFSTSIYKNDVATTATYLAEKLDIKMKDDVAECLDMFPHEGNMDLQRYILSYKDYIDIIVKPKIEYDAGSPTKEIVPKVIPIGDKGIMSLHRQGCGTASLVDIEITLTGALPAYGVSYVYDAVAVKEVLKTNEGRHLDLCLASVKIGQVAKVAHLYIRTCVLLYIYSPNSRLHLPIPRERIQTSIRRDPNDPGRSQKTLELRTPGRGAKHRGRDLPGEANKLRLNRLLCNHNNPQCN